MKKATKQKKEQGNQSIVSQVEEQLKKLKNTKDGITDTMSGYGMAVPKAFSKYPVVLAETCHNLEEKMEMLTIEPELARRISELETKMDAVYGKRFATDLSVLTSLNPGEINNTLCQVPEEVASGATKIAQSRFKNFYSLEQANFEQAVTIENSAFENCSSLSIANFPAATTIGQCAFQNATSLEEASIPTVTTIGQCAFQNATSLTRADFPEVTGIGQYAFRYDVSLQSVAEMDGVETIPVGCFWSCNQLSSVSFPNAIEIGADAFTQCHSLTGANIPEARTIGQNAFYNNKSLVSAVFNKMNSGIGMGTFALNSSLQTAMFPMATSIGERAFAGDRKLKNVDFTNIKYVNPLGFSGCEALEELNVPNLTAVYNRAFLDCQSLTAISTESVENVREMAFYNVPVKHLNLSAVTTLYANAFDGFKGETVDISSLGFYDGGNVISTKTGDSTMRYGVAQENKAIKAIHAPSLQSCGANGRPFLAIRALSGITLPEYQIGSSPRQFENCVKLEYAYLPKYIGGATSNTRLPDNMFLNCASLSSAYIPKTSGVWENAFSECYKIKLLGIPNATWFARKFVGGYANYSPFRLYNNPSYVEYIDYRERTSVITEFNGSDGRGDAVAYFPPTTKFIVPDDLYEEWCQTYAFSACSARVVTQSWFENEGPNYQYTSGW